MTDLVELIQFYSSELIFPLDIDTACHFSWNTNEDEVVHVKKLAEIIGRYTLIYCSSFMSHKFLNEIIALEFFFFCHETVLGSWRFKATVFFF